MPELIRPEDDNYDSARLAWNLAADQHPAAIVIARSADEVVDAVNWARENGLRVAPQTTGHGAPGLPDLSGTLLLKTALYQGDGDIEIDSNAATARVPAGAPVGDVVAAAAERGLALLHGSSPTVGLVGYLLGGGLSSYSRTYGLACNRVASFQVVTEDGATVAADAVSNPDLFWALRGGGGGYGVVTAVEIELMPMSEVFAGATFLPASMAPQVLDAWLNWTRNAPESATTDFRIMRLPPFEEIPEPIRGQTVVCVDGVITDQIVGEEFAGLLDELGPAVMGGWGLMPVADVVRLHGDPEDPVPGTGGSLMLGGLDENAARAFLDAAGDDSGSSLIVAEIRHLGGALSRPAEDGGVLGHLDAEYVFNGIGLAAGPDMSAKATADLDQLVAAMQPWARESKFFNFTERDFTLSDCLPPEAMVRLLSIRNEYCPDGLFVAPGGRD
ncbi:MAG: FAD-binding protein [Actinomycetota bacterium]|nr:FAD-binding protein [Actinomycetota bacterium]